MDEEELARLTDFSKRMDELVRKTEDVERNIRRMSDPKQLPFAIFVPKTNANEGTSGTTPPQSPTSSFMTYYPTGFQQLRRDSFKNMWNLPDIGNTDE